MFNKGFFDLKKRSEGFTLIELLVVISIISVLSTVVLSSLNSARIKARNAQVQQEVGSWMNAINLYKTETGNYPLQDYQELSVVCLGGQHLSCNNNDYGSQSNQTTNNLFKSQLSKYIETSRNPNRQSINIEGGDAVASYLISDYPDGSYLDILWRLDGNADCGYGANKSFSVNTECYYEIEL